MLYSACFISQSNGDIHGGAPPPGSMAYMDAHRTVVVGHFYEGLESPETGSAAGSSGVKGPDTFVASPTR